VGVAVLNKIDLREHYRARRKQAALTVKDAPERAVAHLVQHVAFLSSQHIACYRAYGYEMNTLPLMQAIWQAKKRCYLPILQLDRTLQFARYEPNDVLRSNRFGILEPLPTADILPPEALDVVLLPLIAFDKAGRRLGTGGGYYDRTFAFLNDAVVIKPILLGLAYEAQEAPSLPNESWDVRLQGVVTEQQMMLFG
jgi:5-formyltetrahydrofolate cyclo-ligase